jgi:hypothetical protein
MKVSEAAPHLVGAMAAVSAAFLINMMGTTLPTSIYALYQQHYGFTTPVIMVITRHMLSGCSLRFFLPATGPIR